jgi:hypothetical protein
LVGHDESVATMDANFFLSFQLKTNAMNNHDLTSPAEMQGHTTLELAEARAKAVLANSEARLQALIEEGNRQTQESANQQAASALAPSLMRMEQTARDYINEFLPLTEEFQEAVSIRAYFKAEQRDFGPGQEGHDWAEAERELLDVDPFGTQTE